MEVWKEKNVCLMAMTTNDKDTSSNDLAEIGCNNLVIKEEYVLTFKHKKNPFSPSLFPTLTHHPHSQHVKLFTE
jgi:hypothetical protein